MSTHTEWTCKEFDIQQIMEMILNFWNTPEGKPHTAQLNPISFRAVQAGIKNSTNNTIDIHNDIHKKIINNSNNKNNKNHN